MRGKAAVATRSFLPGSPSKYVYVLIDDRKREVELAEIQNLVQYCEGSDISWFPQALQDEKCTNRRESIVSLHYVVIDLDFSLAENKFGLEALLKEIGKLGLPNPTMVVSTGGGFHVYWSIRKLYIGSRRGKTEQEDRKWHDYWCARYEETTRGLCTLLSHYGADRQATSVTHLFRLPGSYTPKHDIRTEIVYRDDETETSLKDFGAALRRIVKEIKVENPPSPSSSNREYTRTAKRRTLETLAIQWLLHHRIPDGFRYNATFPVIQACFFSGLSEDETREYVYRWNREQCIPPRSESQVEAQIKSCSRRYSDGNPYGISPSRLMEIQAEDGSTMDRSTAWTVFSGLPGGTEFPERPRKHRKRNGRTADALDFCIALIKSGEISGRWTNKSIADRIGLSESAFKKAVKPILLEQGLCSTNLNKVPRTTTYVCSAQPARSTTYETDETKENSSSADGSRLIDEGEVTDGGLLDSLVGAVQNFSRYYEDGRR